MDIKEILTKYGLTVPEDKSKDFDKDFRTTYKHHSELETLQTKLDNANTQLTTANTKLTGYDPEWQTKADTAQAEADKKVNALKKPKAGFNLFSVFSLRASKRPNRCSAYHTE